MNKFKFRKLFSVLENRVKEDGKKSPAWFLGYVEGLGNRKLTGVQIGALVNLLLVPDKDEAALLDSVQSLQTVSDEQLNYDFLSNLSKS